MYIVYGFFRISTKEKWGCGIVGLNFVSKLLAKMVEIFW